MFRSTLPFIRKSLIALVAANAALAASAADSPPASAASSASAPALGAELVKTGLYLITGGGSNSLLRLSPAGSVLIDGKLPGNYRALMSQVRKISKLSDLPVRALMVTDHHDHHIGNAEQFATAGVALIAQRNVKPHLPAAPAASASSAKASAPTVTFDHEYKLRIGGIEVNLYHFGNGPTDSAAVVHFPDLKVVAVGDLVTPDTPLPDFAGGGSLAAWGPVLEQVLKLDFDVVVPSSGPIVGRPELVAFKGKLDALVSRATVLVKQGVAKDRLLAQLKTDDLGWRLNLSAEQLDRLYADLSQTR
jgi:cyclase